MWVTTKTFPIFLGWLGLGLIYGSRWKVERGSGWDGAKGVGMIRICDQNINRKCVDKNM